MRGRVQTTSLAELSPLQLEATCSLPASPVEVFALISDHAALPTWVSGLRRVDVDDAHAESAGGVGTRRTLIPLLGMRGTEIVTHYEPPLRLVYSATDATLRGLLTAHSSELVCEADGHGTRLTWRIRGRLSRSRWKAAFAMLMFRWSVRSSMRNLRRRFR
jgi:uncharacterized protein YndB with AHSA1/START domain